MKSQDLTNLRELTNGILSESTQGEESFMNSWPYTAPYLTEESDLVEGPSGQVQHMERDLDNSVDLFDLLSDFLVSEGYSEKESLEMMAIMTEEQKNEIIEFVAAPAGSPIDRHSRGISKYDKRSERRIRMDNFAAKRTKMLNQPKTP